jgi:heterodisulfide reductase subunit A-like polyferredoxin
MAPVSGAVMVVGGGVAGIQAALDLADSGFFVYLVEKTPAVGGGMSQLDKTFPTTDCSMCILAPYLVTAGRHPNIEMITYAELDTVTGGPGHFTAAVRKKARSINVDRCTGCRACVDACPVTLTADDRATRSAGPAPHRNAAGYGQAA